MEISDYLDLIVKLRKKVKRLEKIIRLQRKEIENLKHQKVSIHTEYVYRDLNNHSNSDWMGYG